MFWAQLIVNKSIKLILQSTIFVLCVCAFCFLFRKRIKMRKRVPQEKPVLKNTKDSKDFCNKDGKGDDVQIFEFSNGR